MNKFKVEDKFNNSIDILNFNELQELAREINNNMILETNDKKDIEYLKNKDFSNIEVIDETLESAQIYIKQLN